MFVGCMDAFFAACLTIDCRDLPEANGRSASAKPSRGKEAVSNLGLSRDQIKSLALLPFSSNLGLDEVFPSQRAAAGHEDVLLAAKVGPQPNLQEACFTLRVGSPCNIHEMQK